MPRREVTGRKPGVSADRGPPLIGGPPPAVYDIRGFCQAHKISTDHYYRMSRAGLGPVVMRLGHRTLISFESAAAWRRRCEEPRKPAVAAAAAAAKFLTHERLRPPIGEEDAE